MKINPLSLLLAAALVGGCDEGKVTSFDERDPQLVKVGNAIADRALGTLDNYSLNPIGKYQFMSFGEDSNPTLVRVDTQTGQAWSLVPENYWKNNNKAYWHKIVEE